MTQPIPDPKNFRIYNDYRTCCQARGVAPVSAVEYVQLWADAAEKVSDTARIDALELWRLKVDAFMKRITHEWEGD